MIAESLLAWYDKNKRYFPFRGTRDPYAIWVSEIMLQQTKTDTVCSFYQRFLERFPTVQSLAAAPEQAVLKQWEGLGYYSRARNMHKTAQIIVTQNSGEFPRDITRLRSLPGIGMYTAAAIASIAFDVQVPAMDGNLIRVMSRLSHTGEDTSLLSTKRTLDKYALSLMPTVRSGDFNQALMDLGASICTPGTPDCPACPISKACGAYAAGDAETLPVVSLAAPPRPVDVAVSIITFENRVLLFKRKEPLLCSLWVFALTEGAHTIAEITDSLKKQGLKPEYVKHTGSARHIFTHRIWNMEIYHFSSDAMTSIGDADWVTSAELEELPFPAAMRAAKKYALDLIGLG